MSDQEMEVELIRHRMECREQAQSRDAKRLAELLVRQHEQERR